MSAARNLVWLGILLASVPLFPGRSLAQGDTASKRDVIYRIAPTYPELARRCNLVGEVHLSVAVAADGKVTSVAVTGGNPVLAQAAVESVRNWKFAPAAHSTTEQVELRFGHK